MRHFCIMRRNSTAIGGKKRPACHCAAAGMTM
jgi:hypothetical protein